MKNPRILMLVAALVGIAGAIRYFESLNTDIGRVGGTEIEAPTRVCAEEKASRYDRAKELSTPDGFINTEPFTIESLIGKKVILVDFWTYSCINCQRTTPYLNSWWEKYKDMGLVIVGVHTPEFEFEKEFDNVKTATEQFAIEYPVILDNDFSTWHAYRNRYWPRKYLIDIDGFIVYDHIGEGGYDETEREIKKALAERQLVLGEPDGLEEMPIGPLEPVAEPEFEKIDTPEIYFGSDRNATFLASGLLNLEGEWKFEDEYATTTASGASIKIEYTAKDVYFVGSADAPVTLKVYKDGVLVNTVTVEAEQLYHLIDDPAGYGQHSLEIIIEGVGLKAYTFTFG